MTQQVFDDLERISREAGLRIMEVYERSETIAINHKPDLSPVTEADLKANEYIINELANIWRDIPILSEESAMPEIQDRLGWQRYWLIDPLDGTKEFINRNDEFTVNIALIENGEPVLGVVHAPAMNTIYFGAKGLGAWKIEKGDKSNCHTRVISSLDAAERRFTVVSSRRHGVATLEPVLTRLKERFGALDSTMIGSSLKLCLVAEGKADFYPRLAPTNEWDTAAAQAVVEAAGGMVVDATFRPLTYNKTEGILNPYFYAIGDSSLNWNVLING